MTKERHSFSELIACLVVVISIAAIGTIMASQGWSSTAWWGLLWFGIGATLAFSSLVAVGLLWVKRKEFKPPFEA